MVQRQFYLKPFSLLINVSCISVVKRLGIFCTIEVLSTGFICGSRKPTLIFEISK